MVLAVQGNCVGEAGIPWEISTRLKDIGAKKFGDLKYNQTYAFIGDIARG